MTPKAVPDKTLLRKTVTVNLEDFCLACRSSTSPLSLPASSSASACAAAVNSLFAESAMGLHLFYNVGSI